jgi:nucleoid DNA-binding protein
MNKSDLILHTRIGPKKSKDRSNISSEAQKPPFFKVGKELREAVDRSKS